MRRVDVGDALSTGGKLLWDAVPLTFVAVALFFVGELFLGFIGVLEALALPATTTAWLVFGSVIGLVLALVAMPLMASVTYGALLVVRGQGLQNGWYLRGFVRLGLVLVVSFVQFAVVAAAAVPLVLGAVVLGGLARVGAAALGFGVLVVIVGVAAFLALVVLFAVRWAVALLHVLDGASAIDALGLSWQETGRHKWAFVGFVFVAVVLQGAADFPGSVIQGFLPFAAIAFSAVLGGAVTVFLALALAVLYENARTPYGKVPSGPWQPVLGEEVLWARPAAEPQM